MDEIGEALNRLAREQMKLTLLRDIRMDRGWDVERALTEKSNKPNNKIEWGGEN